MKHVFIIFVLLWLVACQRPQVHVYSDELLPSQRVQIETRFAELGVEAHFTGVQSPAIYRQPQLFYHPEDVNKALFLAIEQSIKKLGYRALHTNVFNKENHYYSQGNLGLYFPTKEQKLALPKLLSADNCEHGSLRIEVMNNGKWRLLNQAQVHGLWEYEAPYLTLRWFNGEGMVQQAYQGKLHTVITQIGEKEAVTFSALGHRTYMLPILNCDLQTIFI